MIAARLHDFSRTPMDIIKIVKIHESTLRKRLEFEEKTHEVSLTAIRLLQRMKRDWLHTGRRPSGLCGAGQYENLLNPSVILFEFGETPSSSLTLDEFMTVDLEEEQDPPAFKAARKKDRERLQKLIEEEDVDDKVSQLQKEIDKHIEERRKAPAKKRKRPAEGKQGYTANAFL
ncbi:hypothetical protein J437_LFUL006421 [Ladona fulva]|uniref:Transcription factor TFIIB cyclin-like domain-containing protein n=1 Tax=Ladona fulva TaxID=123851 RepID=A0A8K0K4Z9_LADFU|nr:hypothetical protein J437_LFUL006421 [Ladona fulva]